MANSSNKDQFVLDYDKQRLSFIEALKRFNSNKGTPFHRLPEIGGQEVDLYHLYQKVTSMGGWHRVNNDQLWERILSDFWLPKACTNAVEVLKHIYFRYLNLYEKINFLGEDVDTRKNDEDEGPTRKKICLPIESIPLSYNYNQHKLTDAQRQQYNLSTTLKKRNPYEKIELSLQSGLPNDVDHAVNVCVLLSTEGRHTINLQKTTCLIELLLAHIGIFEDDMFLEEMYSSCWTNHTGRDFLRFWYESVKKKDIQALITYKGIVYSQREMAGEQVLNLGRDIGVGDNEGQRVLQMAVFIRNLSFEECNQQILASSSAVFKFLILCLYNTYGNLRQMALDTLANLACEMSLVSVEDFNTQLMLDIIHESLVSEDRFCLVRGMEVLSKIIQPVANLSVLSSRIRSEAYSRLVDLLTIQDIQIIVHSLEALYKLSKAGEPYTTKIAKVHKAIDILVSLITIEAQSFGPGSLVGIKVVEYVPPTSINDGGDAAKRPTTVIQPVNPDCINIYQIPSSQLSQSLLAEEAKDKPSLVAAKTPATKKPTTDIQATSISWLKATYELRKRSKVNQVELFSDYLQFCRKFGIQNSLSSADFLQLAKTIFDQVEVHSINRKNGDRDVFFEGLCKRQTQRPFAVTTVQEDKVNKPVSANVSPQQTPQSTLRQRLMEPLRHSLQQQLIHTGTAAPATTNPTTPAKTAGNVATPGNVKTPISQALPKGKSGRVIVTTPQSKGGKKAVQNGPTTTDAMTDTSCVKTLLAKKLGHSNNTESNTPMDTTNSSNGVSSNSSIHVNSNNNHNHQHVISNTITSQPFNTSQHAPGTFVVCPAITSSPTNRPAYLQGKSSTTTTSIPSNQSISTTTTVPPSSQPHITPLTIQPSSIQSSSSSSSLSPSIPSNNINQTSAILTSVTPSVVTESVRYNNARNSNAQNTNSTSTTPVQNNGGVQGNENNITVDSNISVVNSVVQPCLQNGAAGRQGTSVSVVQSSSHNNGVINNTVPQQINSQAIQPQPPSSQQIISSSSLPNSGVSVVQHQQQQGPNIPFIPQQTIVPHKNLIQGSNNNLITGIVQQQQQFVSQSQSNPSIPINHQIICAPTNNVQPQQQLTPNNVVSMGAATVTQSITTPAVAAAMLTSGSQQIQVQGQQQQQQMVISAPFQQATVQGSAPQSVVIQTQPNTIVMPPRQVLVQGNMGTIQQNAIGQAQQPGTVSFVVPQYRQQSNLIIQQSGAVNVVPSLTLQTQQALAQPTISAAPQTLTGHVSATPLGTRQIIINQTQVPVQMQLSSLQGNTGNICITPAQQPLTQPQQSQQTANVVIQPNQILSQPSQPSSNNNLQLAVNGAQVVMKESLPQRSEVIVNNSFNHNQILQQQQQPQEQVVQISQQQQQNQQPNSQLVIQTSHPNMQQDQLPITSPQCNGVNHEVNGVLGSPDSISSDLPPSPQSTGLQTDNLNGQLSDSDSNKSDLAKLVDKSGRPKINGIIHNFENGCFNNTQPPAPAKISPKVTPKIRIVNGTGSTISSITQQQQQQSNDSGTAKGPQKIIVNVVQRQQQQQTPSAGNGVNINGITQPPQQQHQNSGNVVFQQHQQIVNSSQQPKNNNPVTISRVVVNSNKTIVQQQVQIQQKLQQSGTSTIIHQSQQPSNSVSNTIVTNQTTTREMPSMSPRPKTQQNQTRVSSLPVPQTSGSSSPMLCNAKSTSTTTTKAPHGRIVIAQANPASNSNNATPAGAKRIQRPGQQQAAQTNMPAGTLPPGTKRKAAIVAMTDKTPVRLRGKKKGEAADTPAGSEGQGQTQKQVSIVLEYKCEWGTCRRNFASARRVFLHVFRHHIPKAKESCCQWATCEKMVRKRWSLVSHIQDYHCTEMAMRSACHRRFTLSQNPKATLPPPPPQPMLYPPDAASQAIRRFVIKPPFPEFADQREGPVSKHIRLTAALILRNVCHHSPLGRKLISRHEQQINYNCMNPMDASTALSSCLWDILHYGEAQYKSSTTVSHLP